MKIKDKYTIEYIERPGLHYHDTVLELLIEHLHYTAESCFSKIPNYQVLKGTREDFHNKVLTVAWKPDGTMAGFCSTVILHVKGIGMVQHLGLTCIRPEDRYKGLTYMLTSAVVSGFMLRNKLFGKLWVSNCAAVLSSLGNVALHFERVHPSPFKHTIPMWQQQVIARAIDKDYRNEIYIKDNATFDYQNFVFRGSVKGTVFQKSDLDLQYYHRDNTINNYYRNLMDFNNGDEVLQIGYVSIFSPFKHWLKQSLSGKRNIRHPLEAD